MLGGCEDLHDGASTLEALHGAGHVTSCQAAFSFCQQLLFRALHPESKRETRGVNESNDGRVALYVDLSVPSSVSWLIFSLISACSTAAARVKENRRS